VQFAVEKRLVHGAEIGVGFGRRNSVETECPTEAIALAQFGSFTVDKQYGLIPEQRTSSLK